MEIIETKKLILNEHIKVPENWDINSYLYPQDHELPGIIVNHSIQRDALFKFLTEKLRLECSKLNNNIILLSRNIELNIDNNILSIKEYNFTYKYI
jgi:hypothetical protein